MSEFGAWSKANTPRKDDKPVFRGRRAKPVAQDPYLLRSNICPKCMMPKAVLTGACFCY